MLRRRLLFMAIALDQFLFCWLSLGRYAPDETLSAAAWRWHINGRRSWPMRLIDGLFWPVQKHHCREAYLAEMGGVQLPREYRSAQ